MRLTDQDLDRLEKNGVGGLTTAEEQAALIAEVRRSRQALREVVQIADPFTPLEDFACDVVRVAQSALDAKTSPAEITDDLEKVAVSPYMDLYPSGVPRPTANSPRIAGPLAGLIESGLTEAATEAARALTALDAKANAPSQDMREAADELEGLREEERPD